MYGAKKYLEIGQKLREILWVASCLGLLMAFIFFNLDIVINLFPIKSSITTITIDYLKAVSFGWFFVTIFTCLRCYSEGMTHTKPVFYIAFAGMLLNIPLDLIFVYGWLGAPKLGGVGCGIATTIVSFIMMISIFIYINFCKNYSKTKPFAKFTLPSLHTTKEVLKLGLPIGLGIFIELSMFSGAAIIIGQLGDKVLSGHAIALNIASIVFMLPLYHLYIAFTLPLYCLYITFFALKFFYMPHSAFILPNYAFIWSSYCLHIPFIYPLCFLCIPLVFP